MSEVPLNPKPPCRRGSGRRRSCRRSPLLLFFLHNLYTLVITCILLIQARLGTQTLAPPLSPAGHGPGGPGAGGEEERGETPDMRADRYKPKYKPQTP